MLKYPMMTSKYGVDITPDYEMSFETLFEALMREKNREDLQRLERGFFEEAKKYIAKEKSSVEMQDDFHGAISRIRQLEDMLLEIYSRRERKILSLASIKAKTNADVFDVSAMLDFEKDTFRKIVDILTYNRRLIKSQMKGIKISTESTFAGIKADVSEDAIEFSSEKEESNDNIAGDYSSETSTAFENDKDTSETITDLEGQDFKENTSQNSSNTAENTDNNIAPDKINLKFLKPIGKFVGEELETYGPFDEGDIANIPKSIAKLLIDKEEAEKVE